MLQERAYWLAWTKIPGVGPILLKRIQQYFGTLAEAWVASAISLGAIEGIGDKLIETIVQARGQIDPEKLLAESCTQNLNFWTPADADYPRLLLEIPSPPPVLYYQGEVQLGENQGTTPMVAIVGTRHPTEYGLRWTRKISSALAVHGFTVVSGMATGIDTEAHFGCLEAGGRTLAVLGTGVDVIYPRNNRKLYHKIQQQGLVLSEYPPGTKPDRTNFPARNRIISGLCRATLVMEAPIKSGSLITARFSNEFCRDVYVLPGSLESTQSLGCLRLINKGAQVILGEGELLEMLGTMPKLDWLEQPQSPLPDLEPELQQVLEILTLEPIPFDVIVETSGLGTGEVSSALLQLELLGLVTQLPGMRYTRN